MKTHEINDPTLKFQIPNLEIRFLITKNANRLSKILFHDYFKDLETKIFFASLRSAQRTFKTFLRAEGRPKNDTFFRQNISENRAEIEYLKF